MRAKAALSAFQHHATTVRKLIGAQLGRSDNASVQ
jgi:hypothetical protein